MRPRSETNVSLTYTELTHVYEVIGANCDWTVSQSRGLQLKLLAAINYLEKELDSGEKTIESKPSVFK